MAALNSKNHSTIALTIEKTRIRIMTKLHQKRILVYKVKSSRRLQTTSVRPSTRPKMNSWINSCRGSLRWCEIVRQPGRCAPLQVPSYLNFHRRQITKIIMKIIKCDKTSKQPWHRPRPPPAAAKTQTLPAHSATPTLQRVSYRIRPTLRTTSIATLGSGLN